MHLLFWRKRKKKKEAAEEKERRRKDREDKKKQRQQEIEKKKQREAERKRKQQRRLKKTNLRCLSRLKTYPDRLQKGKNPTNQDQLPLRKLKSVHYHQVMKISTPMCAVPALVTTRTMFLRCLGLLCMWTMASRRLCRGVQR